MHAMLIIEHDADGMDFVPIGTKKDDENKRIFQSNTKEQFLNDEVKYIPKSAYLFWKMVDGKKVYL